MTTALAKREGDVVQAEQTRDTVWYTPKFDIFENDDELILYGDMPGVQPEDLEIRFEGRELTVLGRTSPRHEGRASAYSEYGIGDFYRSFAIGEAIDTEKISAELHNGVLTLHLPKSEQVKPRRIEVKAS